MMKRILIVAAHPDDDILGCGGMMAKSAKEGLDIKVVFIAEGTSCRYDPSQINSSKVIKEIEIRSNYAREALSILGISDIEFFNMPCGRLDTTPLIDIGKVIEKKIKEFKPDTIFTHSDKDTNNDHRIVFQAALQATRPSALNDVQRLYCFEILSSSEWKFIDAFKPNYFVALDKQYVELKIRALEVYESETKEFPFPRSREGLMVQAKSRGMQVGKKYAEAYYLVREIC